MNTFLVSVLYITLWRLGVLGCGIICITLGYKLFQSGSQSEKGSLHTEISGNKLILNNIAPGTFFALFGAGMISILLWTSPAEIIIPSSSDVAAKSTLNTVAPLASGGITLRSDDSSKVDEIVGVDGDSLTVPGGCTE